MQHQYLVKRILKYTSDKAASAPQIDFPRPLRIFRRLSVSPTPLSTQGPPTSESQGLARPVVAAK